MTDNITGAYKRKEYRWFLLIVLGTRVAGIGGAFGSTIIAFGLYRTIKNPEYSTLKKSILSVAYVIAGVVITLLIAALLSWLILTLTRKQTATTQEAMSSSPIPNEALPSSATPLATSTPFSARKSQEPSNNTQAATSPESDAGGELDAKPYINQRYGFTIISPKGWILDEIGYAGTVAYFLNRSIDKEDTYQWQVRINLGVTPGNAGFTLGEYMAAEKNQVKLWSPQYQILSEEKKLINGHESDIISGTFENEGHKFRNLQLFTLEGDNAYMISGTALNSTWERYKDVVAASVESFALQSR